LNAFITFLEGSCWIDVRVIEYLSFLALIEESLELSIHHLTLQFGIQRNLRSRHYDGIVLPSFYRSLPQTKLSARLYYLSPYRPPSGDTGTGARPIRLGSGLRQHRQREGDQT
jgi:hypothetical protein